MAIKDIKVTVHECSDGQRFFDFEEARNYEIRLQLKNFAINRSIGIGGYWDQEMIVKELFEGRSQLSEILSVSSTVSPFCDESLCKELESIRDKYAGEPGVYDDLHIDMDNFILRVLSDLGYKKTVEKYREIAKKEKIRYA